MDRRTFIPLMGTALVGAASLSFTPKEDDEQEQLEQLYIKPRRLIRGNTIGITAPAGSVRSKSDVSEFMTTLNTLGFRTKISLHIYGEHGYLSATDEVRAAEFMDFIEDPEIDAIFSIRGGWGCARMLELLDFDVIKKNPKIIMGFSDITSLLNAIYHKTGLVTFHGPNGNSSWNSFTAGHAKDVLINGKAVKYSNRKGVDQHIQTYSGGIASGPMIGGNLSVLCGITGSEYLPDPNGKILFLEDLREEPYRIDRMLTQLSLAGIFRSVNGIVLGNFKGCGPNEPNSFEVGELFEHHFANLGIPVFHGAQIGHISDIFTIPVGLPVTIDANLGTITLNEPSVK